VLDVVNIGSIGAGKENARGIDETAKLIIQ
jgi:hypothetical protein